jgi:hypothetical protein
VTTGNSAPWLSVAINDAGNKMLAGTYNGRLYVSSDGGTSWAETRPAGNVNKIWFTVAVSADGKTMLAGTGTRLYRSTDGGATWAETQPAGNNDADWRGTAIGNGGQTLAAAARYGRVYTSTNGGTSWAETQPEGNVNRYWYALAMSDDGNRILAGAYSAGLEVSGTIGDVSDGLAAADSDGDGVLDSVEVAGANSGDANNDSVSDDVQGNVTNVSDPVNTKRVIVEDANQSCALSGVTVAAESGNATADAGYDYPAGMVNFTSTCGTAGFTTTITQYYYGVTDNNYVLRKYNPTTHAYTTVTGVTKQQVTIGGQTVLKVSYSVTDGGALDTDGAANGVIADPAGLASAISAAQSGGSGQLTDTGTNLTAVYVIATALITSAVVVARRSASTRK